MKHFVADTHFSHTNSLTWEGRNQFSSIEEMNEKIMSNIVEPLKAGDDLYVIGDISWNEESAIELIRRVHAIGARIHLVLGNHDDKVKKILHMFDSYDKMMDVYIKTPFGKKLTVLCHFPLSVWNKSHWNSWHLHGHIHMGETNRHPYEEKTSGKVINVNCEYHNFKPLSEIDIFEIMKNKPDNFDLIRE